MPEPRVLHGVRTLEYSAEGPVLNNDFIRESNRGTHLRFLATHEELEQRLAATEKVL